MQHLCRQYMMPRCEKKTRAKVWILKNPRIGPVLDIKVCRHGDRYSIEVLIESLFRDRTASWVRIVSGIDKSVTVAMQSKEEVHRASGRLCCQSKTATEARSDAVVRFYSCSWKKMDRHWNTTITRSTVLSSVKSHDPMTTTWSNSPSVHWRSSSIWRRFGRVQEEKVRRHFAMVAWKLFEQFKDIQEIMLLVLHCKTMYCYRKDFLSTSTTLRTRMSWIP